MCGGMDSKRVILIKSKAIIAFYLFLIGDGVYGGLITVYTELNYGGLDLRLDVTDSCVNLPEEFQDSVKSIDVHGNCVQLYLGDNCTSNFLKAYPPSVTHEPAYVMSKGQFFHRRIRSIGPCELECKTEYIRELDRVKNQTRRSDGKKGPRLEMFRGKTSTTLFLTGCVPIPLTHKNKITGYSSASDMCFQTYFDKQCTKIANRFHYHKNGPSLRSDFYWRAEVNENGGTDVPAISLCGLNCNRNKYFCPASPVLPTSRTSVVLFNNVEKTGLVVPNVTMQRVSLSMQDFPVRFRYEEIAKAKDWQFRPIYNRNFEQYSRGYNDILDLKRGSCWTVEEEWTDEVYSLDLFGKCIFIYKRKNCTVDEDDFANTTEFRLDNSNLNLHGDLKTGLIPFNFLSLRLCSNYEGMSRNESGIINQLEPNHLNAAVIVLSTVGGFAVLIIIFLVFLRIRLKTPEQKAQAILSELELQDFILGTANLVSTSINDEARAISTSAPYNKSYDILRDLISFDKKDILGWGQYAVVYKGFIRSPDHSKYNIVVALKTVKPFAEVEYVVALLKEIKVMIYVGNHPHLVKLLGCCTENMRNGDVYVLTELCARGSLDKFLANRRDTFVSFVVDGKVSISLETQLEYFRNLYENTDANGVKSSYKLTTCNLLRWSSQIANGMKYLVSKKVIHGDLAARNILLDARLEIKISDFGLSKQLYEYGVYVKKKKAALPWRWLSIETMKRMEFSSESDVWSYGITIWEIFNLGDIPYPGESWNNDFLRKLSEGMRLPHTEHMTEEWHETLMSCWTVNPKERITFEELEYKFGGISDRIRSAVGARPEDINGESDHGLHYLDEPALTVYTEMPLC